MRHYLTILQQTMRENWGKPVLSDYQGETFTFADLASNMARLHRVFEAAGVQPGDRVALAARNSARWAMAFLSIATYRGVAVSILADFNPIDIAGERLGTLFIYKAGKPYSIDDIILSEYGTTVVGLEMMRSVNEENAEENRKVQIVRSAIGTLSFSELEAITHIFEELEGNEGILVASKIADRVGITRSVIVNALRKFESAVVIESRSSGMKGTYIKVLNDVVFDELKNL